MSGCQAIIKSGPRKGQRCGRYCFRGDSNIYCEQYHSRMRIETKQEFPLEIKQESKYEFRNIRPEPRTEARPEPQRPTLRPEPRQEAVTRDQINATIEYFASESKSISKELKKESFMKFFLPCINRPSSLTYQQIIEDCAICTCQPNKEETWVVLSCGHNFHIECIKDWVGTFVRTDKGCPLCRKEIIGTQKKFYTPL